MVNNAKKIKMYNQLKTENIVKPNMGIEHIQ